MEEKSQNSVGIQEPQLVNPTELLPKDKLTLAKSQILNGPRDLF